MLSLVLGLVVATAPAPTLAEARRLSEAFKFDAALEAVDQALTAHDLDLETLIALHEFEAITAAKLDKAERARDAFVLVLSLRPDYQLSKNLPPRTRTPFFEARTLAAKLGAVALAIAPAEKVAGQVTSVAVTGHGNSRLVARAVRFRVEADDGPPVTTTVALEGERARCPARGKNVKWSATLLGDREAVLAQVSGDEQAPPPPPPLPVATLADPAPPANRAGPSTRVTQADGQPGAWLRPTGFTLGAVGLAAVGVGALLGVLANVARTSYAQAAKNGAGAVVGMTQREAAALELTAQRDALVANVLFVAGGVLAATGVTFIVVERVRAPASLALTVGPAGLGLHGRF